eukprot:14506263-Alexandrium_andersonii.AAC.1
MASPRLRAEGETTPSRSQAPSRRRTPARHTLLLPKARCSQWRTDTYGRSSRAQPRRKRGRSAKTRPSHT